MSLTDNVLKAREQHTRQPDMFQGADTLERDIDRFKLEQAALRFGLPYARFAAAYRECFESGVKPE